MYNNPFKMKNTFYLLSFLLIVNLSNAQSPLYSISSYQDTYEPLDTFTSLFFEIGEGHGPWSLTFDLGFDFPFFNRVYDYINIESGSYAHFDDTDYDILLFCFFNYLPDIVYTWPIELESDVRYRFKTITGMQALVIEFLKNRLDPDPSVEEFDSHVNFQIWFFEDGSMEVRFGEINLENSPCYVPGDGFYFIGNDPPPYYLHGPHMFLRDPDNPDDGIGLEGSYDNYEILPGYGHLTFIPPPGWVIRFNRESVSTKDVKINEPKIYPNPADGYFSMKHDRPIDIIEIFDQTGRSIKSVPNPSGKISTESLVDGFYLLKCSSGEHTSTHKLVVQNQ